MSALYPIGTQVFTGELPEDNDQTFAGPAGPTILPEISLETDFPPEVFDPSASNRKFQTSIIIKQDPQRSGVLFYLQERIENQTPPPTRTPGTGVRPGYGG